MNDKPKTALGMPGVMVVLDRRNDQLDNDEVIKAHNDGRPQSYIAKYLRKVLEKHHLGQLNTEGERAEVRGKIQQVLHQLEQLGIVDPQVNVVDVHTDDELDHIFEGGEPDPGLVHINVGDKKMVMRLRMGEDPEDNSR